MQLAVILLSELVPINLVNKSDSFAPVSHSRNDLIRLLNLMKVIWSGLSHDRLDGLGQPVD